MTNNNSIDQEITTIQDFSNDSNPRFIKANNSRQIKLKQELKNAIKQSGMNRLNSELGPIKWKESYIEGDDFLHKVAVPTVKHQRVTSILYFYGSDDGYNIFLYKKEKLDSIVEDVSEQHAHNHFYIITKTSTALSWFENHTDCN